MHILNLKSALDYSLDEKMMDSRNSDPSPIRTTCYLLCPYERQQLQALSLDKLYILNVPKSRKCHKGHQHPPEKQFCLKKKCKIAIQHIQGALIL